MWGCYNITSMGLGFAWLPVDLSVRRGFLGGLGGL